MTTSRPRQGMHTLHESEEIYRRAFEKANLGMCLVDLKGKILQANEKMSEIFGYSQPELEAITVNDLAVPEDAPVSTLFMGEAIAGSEDQKIFEKRYYHRDGHIIHGQVASSLVRDVNGEPLYFISQVQDITERKRAEERIKASEEKFRKAFMTAADAFFLATLNEGRIIEANESFKDVFGFTREEAIGKTSVELGLYADPNDRKNWVAELKACGQVRNLKLQGRKKGGARLIASLSVSLIDGSDQKLILGTAKDITEQLSAQNALRASELKYRILFETADDAIMLFAEEQWVDCNESALQMFGATREQIIGAHPSRFSPPTQPDGEPSDELARTKIRLASANEPQSFEWLHCRADGTTFDAEVHLNRLDLEGKVFIQGTLPPALTSRIIGSS